MIQTTQRELEAFYAMAMPGFYEYLKSHSTSVGGLELATTLEGITTLPGRYNLGGVEKNVLVPLNLLTKDVDTLIDACVAATAEAKAAKANADAAAKKVTDAITDISAQKQAALNAASSANSAAALATSAKSACDTVAQTCREVTASCTSRTSECVNATTSCRNATQECINETVNTRAATVEAKTAAATARSEASNLTALKTACQDVTTRCDSTNSTAEEKIVEMDALLKSVSGEANASPVRMEVSAPAAISTKNKVVQKISVQLYPSYVMKNILFQKVQGTSLTVSPSGILRTAGTGTSSFYVIPAQNTELWRQVDIVVRTPLIRLTSTGKIRLSGNKMRIV